MDTDGPPMSEAEKPPVEFVGRLKFALQESSILGDDGKPFVLVEHVRARLKDEMNAHPADINGDTSVEHEAADSTVVMHDSRYLDPILNVFKVVCILVDIEASDQISHFLNLDICDSSLPINLEELQRRFVEPSGELTEVAKRFVARQGLYNAVRFELGGTFAWDTRQTIPICAKELLSSSRTSDIYEVAIPEEFLDIQIQNLMISSRFEDTNVCPGACYRLALKVFGQSDLSYGRTEAAVVQQLRNSKLSGKNEGFMHHLCNFEIQRQMSSTRPMEAETTASAITLNYNILMECATSDLGRFLTSDHPPPVLAADLEWFWRKTRDLVATVGLLHEGFAEDSPSESGKKITYVGYHHDLKPSNILIFEDHFRLADFGCASFQSLDGPEKLSSTGHGTISYGPPESTTKKSASTAELLAFDLWSLGCILSLAATWVTLGAQGVKQFRKLRYLAHERRVVSSADKDSNLEMASGDMFHDGQRVMKVVTEWHQYLYNARRVSDTITPSILDIVDGALLVDVGQRIDAAELVRRLDFILGRQKNCLSVGVGDELQSLLEEAEGEETEDEDDFVDSLQ